MLTEFDDEHLRHVKSSGTMRKRDAAQTITDTNRLSAGGEEAEAEKGRVMDGWMDVRGRKLDGGNDDPWIG